MFSQVSFLLLQAAVLVVADSTKSLQACTTLLGKTSRNPVPTASFALTFTSKATVKSTSTPEITITPPPGTSTFGTTVTDTATTTVPQETDTFTTTIIDYATSTIIPSTITSTVVTGTTTITTTLPVSTTTIAPPAGFTPANQVLHAKRDAEVLALPRRAAVDLVERAAPSGTACRRDKDGHPTFAPNVYPTQVACAALIQVYQTITSIATASTTATITAPPGSAISTTTTDTLTTTVTEIPIDASTTITETSTSTVSTTVVPTTTVSTLATATVTITPPQATYYAACGPTNQLSTVNGVPINGAQFYNGATNPAAGSAYDCCVACQKNANCGAYLFFPGPFCYNSNKVSSTCSNPALGLYLDAAGVPDVVAGSGACGTVNLGPTS